MASLVIPAYRLSSWYSLQPKSRCLTLWTLPEHWHCVESYDGRRIKKALKHWCPSRNWWIVEAIVWSVPVMSFVGFQLGPQPLCLRAVLQYSCPLVVVVHICCHSLRLASWAECMLKICYNSGQKPTIRTNQISKRFVIYDATRHHHSILHSLLPSLSLILPRGVAHHAYLTRNEALWLAIIFGDSVSSRSSEPQRQEN